MHSRQTLTCLAAVLLVVGAVGCGGSTQFAGDRAIAIAGTPPPPPPPPPKPVEAPKPPPRVELRDNKIEFKEKIQFEVNKAIIKEESFSLLKDIGDVIKQNPHVKKLSIEGHASSEGDPKKNKKLSDDRAKSVMDHLVKKEGIDAARLVAKGWGVEKPIADNATEDGREKNRRVEFLVVEQDITAKKVEIDPVTGKEKIVEEKKETQKAPDAPATTAADGKTPAAKPADGKTPDGKTPAAKPAPKPTDKAAPAVKKTETKTEEKK